MSPRSTTGASRITNRTCGTTARRVDDPDEAKAKYRALQAITKKGKAKDDEDPGDSVRDKDDKIPYNEGVKHMRTGYFIRSRALEMFARSEEEVKLTQLMDIKQHKADYQTAGTTRAQETGEDRGRRTCCCHPLT